MALLLIMTLDVAVLNWIYLHLTICPRWTLKHHGKVNWVTSRKASSCQYLGPLISSAAACCSWIQATVHIAVAEKAKKLNLLLFLTRSFKVWIAVSIG